VIVLCFGLRLYDSTLLHLSRVRFCCCYCWMFFVLLSIYRPIFVWTPIANFYVFVYKYVFLLILRCNFIPCCDVRCLSFVYAWTSICVTGAHHSSQISEKWLSEVRDWRSTANQRYIWSRIFLTGHKTCMIMDLLASTMYIIYIQKNPVNGINLCRSATSLCDKSNMTRKCE
jgi:hypothetical protein